MRLSREVDRRHVHGAPCFDEKAATLPHLWQCFAPELPSGVANQIGRAWIENPVPKSGPGRRNLVVRMLERSPPAQCLSGCSSDPGSRPRLPKIAGAQVIAPGTGDRNSSQQITTDVLETMGSWSRRNTLRSSKPTGSVTHRRPGRHLRASPRKAHKCGRSARSSRPRPCDDLARRRGGGTPCAKRWNWRYKA